MTRALAANRRRSFVRVIEVDPELAAGFSKEERRRAGRHLLARTTTLLAGEWDPLRDCPPQHEGALGMLVVEGLLARRVRVRDATSLELLGPGDVTRPWESDRESEHALHTVSWSSLGITEVAWLDHEFAHMAARWPEIAAQLVRRSLERVTSLACHLAISHMVGVEARILCLLDHLAERWGRVTPQGVLVPVPLTNEMLGAMIGARPPSVSTALGKLARAGSLVRRHDGTWLLHHHAVVPEPPVTLTA